MPPVGYFLKLGWDVITHPPQSPYYRTRVGKSVICILDDKLRTGNKSGKVDRGGGCLWADNTVGLIKELEAPIKILF